MDCSGIPCRTSSISSLSSAGRNPMKEPDMCLIGIRSGSPETKSFWTCSVKTVRANKTKPNDFLSVSPSRLFLQRPFFAVFGKSAATVAEVSLDAVVVTGNTVRSRQARPLSATPRTFILSLSARMKLRFPRRNNGNATGKNRRKIF